MRGATGTTSVHVNGVVQARCSRIGRSHTPKRFRIFSIEWQKVTCASSLTMHRVGTNQEPAASRDLLPEKIDWRPLHAGCGRPPSKMRSTGLPVRLHILLSAYPGGRFPVPSSRSPSTFDRQFAIYLVPALRACRSRDSSARMCLESDARLHIFPEVHLRTVIIQ